MIYFKYPQGACVFQNFHNIYREFFFLFSKVGLLNYLVKETCDCKWDSHINKTRDLWNPSSCGNYYNDMKNLLLPNFIKPYIKIYKNKGIRTLFREGGMKLLFIIFIFYLVRDTILYVIPFLLAYYGFININF